MRKKIACILLIMALGVISGLMVKVFLWWRVPNIIVCIILGIILSYKLRS